MGIPVVLVVRTMAVAVLVLLIEIMVMLAETEIIVLGQHPTGTNGQVVVS